MPPARLQLKTRLFAVIVILSNALGNFFIARGMRGLTVPADSALHLVQAVFTPWVALGITLLLLWLLTRMLLLSWADLSYVLPITSLGYVATAMMGHFFLGEHITPARCGGTLLIIAGTVLVGLGARTAAPRAAEPVPVALSGDRS